MIHNDHNYVFYPPTLTFSRGSLFIGQTYSKQKCLEWFSVNYYCILHFLSWHHDIESDKQIKMCSVEQIHDLILLKT